MSNSAPQGSEKTSLPLAHLVGRGLCFRYLQLTGRPGRIQALSLELTRRCMARCQMCNIWKTPKETPELATADWLELLADPLLRDLRELDLTGGEPFLRQDLGELFREICRLKRSHLSKLQSIAITTNGFLSERILQVVAELLPELEQARIGLVFAFGFDAVGELHDKIRGYPGGWQKLEATIKGLTLLRERHPGLVLGAKTTVTRHNIGELDKVAGFADEHGMFTIVSPYILTPARYGNLDLDDNLSLSVGDLETLKAFYASPRFKWSYFRRELLRYLEDGRMRKPCSAGVNYYFVRSNGDIYPCPLREVKLGNLSETSLAELMITPAAAEFRRGVGRFAECRSCTEPGLERYALPCEGFHYLAQLFRLGPQGLRQLHRHLGLDKYFP
jgi:MoaA/NifB/PqqE/SkfB family radical SAM enzyme